MPGWPEHLYETMTSSQLVHLAVHSFTDEHWAHTPGLKLSLKECRDLEKALKQGSSYRPDTINMFGEVFRIDRREISNVHLHATFTTRRKRGSAIYDYINDKVNSLEELGDLSAWVTQVNDYVIVAVGRQEQSNVCQTAAYDIRRHLRNTIGSRQSS